MRLTVAIGLVATVLAGAPPKGGFDGDSHTPPPPVLAAGARSVETRDADGHVERITTIPSASMFGRYAGGSTATCTYIAPEGGYTMLDGRVVPEGTEVVGHYVFIEGVNNRLDRPFVDDRDGLLGVVSAGPLATAFRWFTSYCDAGQASLYSIEYIRVPYLDPLLDPRRMIDELRNELDLERPVVYENPIIDRFGGLVTRYPTWLAILPDSWRPQLSAPRPPYRGATLALTADPRELSFAVDFTPDPDKPSPAQHITISCVPDVVAVSGNGALPAFPTLPDQTEPGANGPCMWTPPGPGTVTITAQITYTITFWVDRYTQPDEDYVWTSLPTTYVTGELNAVNTKP